MIVIADTHFRGTDIDWQMDVVLQNLNHYDNAHGVMHLGDLFHFSHVGDTALPACRIVKKVGRMISESRKQWCILAGNHDLISSHYSALEFLEYHPQVTIVREPTWNLRYTKTKGFENTSSISVKEVLVMLPWMIGGAEAVYSFLKKVPAAETIKIFGHADLVGFKHEGIEINKHQSEFCLDPKRIRKIFPDSRVVALFGHIHRTDLRVEDNEQFIYGYIGSMYPTSFSEAGHAGSVVFQDRWGMATKPLEGGMRYAILTEKEAHQFVPEPGCRYRIKIRLEDGSNAKFKWKDADVRHLTPKVSRSVKAPKALTADEQFDSYWSATYTGTPPAWLKSRVMEAFDVTNKSRSSRVDCLTLKKIGKHQDLKVEFLDGLTVMLGPTGSGKSTILEAIPLALWSKILHRRKVSELVSSGSEVTIQSGDRRGSRIWHGQYRLDGERIGAGDWKQWVDDTFGSESTWKASCLLSQDREDDILTRTPSECMQRLQRILGLDGFPALLAESKEKLSQMRKHDIGILKAQESNLESSIEDLKTSIAELSSKVDRDKLAQSKKAIESYRSLMEERQSISKRAGQYEVLVARMRSAMLSELRKRKSCSERLANWKESLADVGCKNSPLRCVFLKPPQVEEPDDLGFSAQAWNGIGLDADGFLRHAATNHLFSQEGSECWLKDQSSPDDESITETLDESYRYVSFAQSTRERISEKKGELAVKEERLEEVRTSLRKLEKKALWLELLVELAGPKGLPGWVTEQALVPANEILTRWSDVALDSFGIRFGVSLDLCGDDLLIHCEMEDGIRLAHTRSGGERALCRTAVLLALAMSRGVGMVWLDEPFAGVSSEWLEYGVYMLQEASKVMRVVVVTHDAFCAVTDANVIRL